MENINIPFTIHVVLTIIGIAFSIYLPISIYKYCSDYFNKKCTAKKRNFFLLLIWVLPIILIGFILYLIWGIIKPESIARVDIIILFSLILGIIGAVWAFFARIDAEQAYKEAITTRLSFGNSFNFPDIFEEDYANKRLPYIIDNIGVDNSIVSLYIGFPCIAFFYGGQDKLRIEPETIEKNFIKLIFQLGEVIKSFKKQEDKEFTINLGIFNKEEIRKCFPKLKDGEEPIIPYTGGRNLLNEWKNVIQEIITLKSDEEKNKNKKVNIIWIERENERFRFSSFRKTIGHEQRALIWVVPDFYYTNTFEFNSAGFQTSDISIIEMLEKVFTMAKHSSKPEVKKETPPSTG